MKAIFARLCSCFIGLAAGCLLFDIQINLISGLLCVVLLVIMYVFIRPLAQVILLPFNLFLLGILNIAADALLVCWAAAWTPDLSVTYLQALLIAALIGLCHIPYGQSRRRELLARQKT